MYIKLRLSNSNHNDTVYDHCPYSALVIVLGFVLVYKLDSSELVSQSSVILRGCKWARPY